MLVGPSAFRAAISRRITRSHGVRRGATHVPDADEHVLGELPAQHGARLVADADQLAGGPLGLPRRHLPPDPPRHAAVHAAAET